MRYKFISFIIKLITFYKYNKYNKNLMNLDQVKINHPGVVLLLDV